MYSICTPYVLSKAFNITKHSFRMALISNSIPYSLKPIETIHSGYLRKSYICSLLISLKDPNLFVQGFCYLKSSFSTELSGTRRQTNTEVRGASTNHYSHDSTTVPAFMPKSLLKMKHRIGDAAVYIFNLHKPYCLVVALVMQPLLSAINRTCLPTLRR